MATSDINELGLVRSAREETEESYFVSMTDIMVGLLFIFIIMLMAFGLMLKIETEDLRQTQETADSVRTQMLRDIENQLREVGIRVIVREENGVLQLPDEILFASDEAVLSPEGAEAIAQLAIALDAILPCYSRASLATDAADCRIQIPDAIRLEAVFVEGHTDSDGPQGYNWDLSARRAINTFIELDGASRVATKLSNDDGQFLFSISGYGENRPVNVGQTEEDKGQNRRIDLRFVMGVSHSQLLEGERREFDTLQLEL